jgi:6-phosphogluconolactonase
MSPLPCTLIETTSPDEFIDQATALLGELILRAIAQRDECILGLSGGSTPGPVYTALGMRKDIDWTKVKIFLVDDRLVAPTAKDSNQRLIRETLLAEAEIPAANIYFPDTTLPIDMCVLAYAEALVYLFSKHAPDVLTLGLGPDGHIASLFPPLPEEAFGEVLALHTMTDTFTVRDRISVSPLVIIAALTQVLIITGEEKRKILLETMNAELDPVRRPLQAALATGKTVAILG